MATKKLKTQIKESIERVKKEKDLLYELLTKAGIDSEEEPCEAMETLISACDELSNIDID
jgi:ferritin-like metal-binding protein YciE